MKVVSIERSLFKAAIPRFSADFAHPLSCERPIKVLVPSYTDLGYVKSISKYYTVHTSGNALFLTPY
jgi:hypothetical protein